MQVQRINFTPLLARKFVSNNHKNADKTPQNNSQTNNKYNQFEGYRDFNISFMAQLNRTPANFYQFNKDNLPESMTTYLDGDYDDRKNIPPAQMMKIVYGDINKADTLDDVREYYSDEPLFANLTDTPNRKAKKGLVYEIESLNDEMGSTPLFKDGNSNVGMYLLKKIYLEGKQKKEINEDFYNDISDSYKGLITSPVDYTTMNAYGIKFPKTPFWNSFVVTRDDWNYVYKPRTPIDSRVPAENSQNRERSLADVFAAKDKVDKRPPKFKLKDYEVPKFTDAIIEGHGDVTATQKQLKKRGIKDNDKLTFVSKYLGEIMSIVLDRIHASDEMRGFFDEYDTLNKKQKEKFEDYWKQNPQMREYQSLVMSDTIKLFFETYGADGNNDDFQGLIDYAKSIKPERQKHLEEHNKRQQELEEIFGQEDGQTPVTSAVEEVALPKQLTKDEVNAKLQEEAIKHGAKVYEFTAPDGQVYSFICNVDEVLEESFRDEMKLLPTAFVNRYLNFIKKSPLATPEYKQSIAMFRKVPSFVQEKLMQPEEYIQVSTNLNNEFSHKNRRYPIAASQAFSELLLDKLNCDPKYAMMIVMDSTKLIDFAEKALNLTSLSATDRRDLDNNYLLYTTPLKNKREITNVAEQLTNFVTNVKPDSTKWIDDDGMYDDLIRLLAANIRIKPELKSTLSKIIRRSEFIDSYGGTERLLLKDKFPEEVKDIKRKVMIEDFFATHIGDIMPLVAFSAKNINTYIRDDELRSVLLQNTMNLYNMDMSKY